MPSTTISIVSNSTTTSNGESSHDSDLKSVKKSISTSSRNKPSMDAITGLLFHKNSLPSDSSTSGGGCRCVADSTSIIFSRRDTVRSFSKTVTILEEVLDVTSSSCADDDDDDDDDDHDDGTDSEDEFAIDLQLPVKFDDDTSLSSSSSLTVELQVPVKFECDATTSEPYRHRSLPQASERRELLLDDLRSFETQLMNAFDDDDDDVTCCSSESDFDEKDDEDDDDSDDEATNRCCGRSSEDDDQDCEDRFEVPIKFDDDHDHEAPSPMKHCQQRRRCHGTSHKREFLLDNMEAFQSLLEISRRSNNPDMESISCASSDEEDSVFVDDTDDNEFLL